MPERIQLRRTKGWRKPPGAVVVARPTKWGNPYVVHEHTDRCHPDHLDCPDHIAADAEHAVELYRHAVTWPVLRQPRVPTPDEIRTELAGHDLACWCPLVDVHGQRVPCHADVLLEIANREVPHGA